MSHRKAVLTMLLVTLLWSMAGVVSRQLQSAAVFEVTFWRSASNALALWGLLGARMGFAALGRTVWRRDWVLWASGLCWCVMFTAFMVAMTLTTVANVLITMALAPLFTALVSRVALGQKLPGRTWAAIMAAGAGIAWMYGSQVAAASLRDGLGIAVAFSVPVAGSTMWILLQHNAQRGRGAPIDMTPAVLIGACLSALVTLPLSWPFGASGQDVLWLSFLGVFQLAVPCMLAVAAGKVLKAPEAALLGLLEIVFGVAWTWLGGSESPTPAVVGGGGLVLVALAANEAIALVQRRG